MLLVPQPHQQQDELFCPQNIVLQCQASYKIDQSQTVNQSEIILYNTGYLKLENNKQKQFLFILNGILEVIDQKQRQIQIRLTLQNIEITLFSDQQYKQFINNYDNLNKQWTQYVYKLIQYYYTDSKHVWKKQQIKYYQQKDQQTPTYQQLSTLVQQLISLHYFTEGTKEEKKNDNVISSTRMIIDEDNDYKIYPSKQNTLLIERLIEVNDEQPEQEQIKIEQIKQFVNYMGQVENSFDIKTYITTPLISIFDLQTQLQVGGKTYNNNRIWIFESNLCIEANYNKTDVIYIKLMPIQIQYQADFDTKTLEITQNSQKIILKLQNSLQLIFIQRILQQLQQGQSFSSDFPSLYQLFTPIDRFNSKFAHYVKLIQNTTQQQIKLQKNVNIQQQLQTITNSINQSTQLTIDQINSLTSQTDFATFKILTENINEQNEMTKSMTGLYYCCIISNYLVFYKNHNSLIPSFAYNLQNSISQNAENITGLSNTIEIQWLEGKSIFIQLLPQLSTNSNKINQQKDEQGQNKNTQQPLLYTMLQELNDQNYQNENLSALNFISSARSLRLQDFSRLFVQYFRDIDADDEILAAYQVNISNPQVGYKSSQGYIFLLQRSFAVLSPSQQYQQQLQYYQIQQIELKGSNIEILAADQLIIVKPKTQDKYGIYQSLLELYNSINNQSEIIQAPCTAISSQSLGYSQWTYIKDQQTSQYKRVLMTVLNNTLQIYENEYSSQPQKLMDLNICKVKQYTQQLLPQTELVQLSLNEAKQQQQYQTEIQGTDEYQRTDQQYILQMSQNQYDETQYFSQNCDKVYKICMDIDQLTQQTLILTKISNFEAQENMIANDVIQTQNIQQRAQQVIQQLKMIQKQNVLDIIDKQYNNEQQQIQIAEMCPQLFKQNICEADVVFLSEQLQRLNQRQKEVVLQDYRQIIQQSSSLQHLMSLSTPIVLFNGIQKEILLFSSNMQAKQFIESIEQEIPQLPEEINSSLSEVLIRRSDQEVDQLCEFLNSYQVVLKPYDFPLDFYDSQILLTPLQIIFIGNQQKFSLYFNQVKNYKIKANYKIQLQTFDNKILNIDTTSQKICIQIANLVELNRRNEMILTGNEDQYNIAEISRLLKVIEKTQQTTEEEEYYQNYSLDKNIILDSRLVELYNYRVKKLIRQIAVQFSIESADEYLNMIDKQAQLMNANNYICYETGFNRYLIGQLFGSNKMPLKRNQFYQLLKPQQIITAQMLSDSYWYNPNQLTIKNVIIAFSGSQIYIYNYSQNCEFLDKIQLQDCIFKQSNDLIDIAQSETTRQQNQNEKKQQNRQLTQVYDFGDNEQKIQQQAQLTQVQQNKIIKDMEQIQSNSSILSNLVGIYYLKRKSYFFILNNKNDIKLMKKIMDNSVPQMTNTEQHDLDAYSQIKNKQQLQQLLSLNQLFSGFNIEQKESLITYKQYEKIFPCDGQIVNGKWYTEQYSDQSKNWNGIWLTQNTICIQNVQTNRVLRIMIKFSEIDRITQAGNSVIIVYISEQQRLQAQQLKKKPQESRMQITNVENFNQFLRLLNDILFYNRQITPRSLYTIKPTGFAAQYSNNILLAECMIFIDEKFQKCILSINNVEDRVSKKQVLVQKFISIYQNISDQEPLISMDFRHSYLNNEKEKIFEIYDLHELSDEMKENTLILYQVKQNAVKHILVQFQDQQQYLQAYDIILQGIREQNQQITFEQDTQYKQEILDYINQIKSRNERNVIQQQFDERLKLDENFRFLGQYKALMISKQEGAPAVLQMSNNKQQNMMQQLMQKQEEKKEFQMEQFLQDTNQFTSDQVTIRQSTPVYVINDDQNEERENNIVNIFVLDKVLGIISKKQQNIIEYSQIISIQVAPTIVLPNNNTIQDVIQQYPDMYKNNNTIIISFRQLKNQCVQQQTNDQLDQNVEQITEILPDDDEDLNVDQHSDEQYSNYTIQFMLIPQTNTNVFSIQQVIPIINHLENKNTELTFDYQMSKQQQQAYDLTHFLTQQILNLSLVSQNNFSLSFYHQIIDNTCFINYQFATQNVEVLSDNLELGFQRALVIISNHCLFVIDDQQEQLHKYINFNDKVNQFYTTRKLIDLRRSKVQDGKSLTNLDNTLCVLGGTLYYSNLIMWNKLYEQSNIPIFQVNSKCQIADKQSQQFEYNQQIVNKYYKEHFTSLQDDIVQNQDDKLTNLFNQYYHYYNMLQKYDIKEYNQNIEQFTMQQPVVIKFLSTDEEQKFKQVCQGIISKYPENSKIQSQLNDFSGNTSSIDLQEWSNIGFKKDSLILQTKCNLSHEQVKIQGTLYLGRTHLMFVGQLLQSKVYVLRRYQTFVNLPKWEENGKVQLFGGLIDPQPTPLKIKVPKYNDPTVMEKENNDIANLQIEINNVEQQYQKIINDKLVQVNIENTLVFENIQNRYVQSILNDLIQLNLGLIPDCVKHSNPSYSSLFPNIFNDKITIYSNKEKQWIKYDAVIYMNYLYLFNEQDRNKAAATITLYDLKAKQCFVDKELYENLLGENVESENSDDDRYEEEIDIQNIENKNQNIQLSDIQLLKSVVRTEKYTQVVQLLCIGNKVLDNLVNDQFDFGDEDSDVNESYENQDLAELYISANSPQTLENFYRSLTYQYDNYQNFIQELNETASKINHIELNYHHIIYQQQIKCLLPYKSISIVQYVSEVQEEKREKRKKQKILKQEVVGKGLEIRKRGQDPQQIYWCNIQSCYIVRERGRKLIEICIEYTENGIQQMINVQIPQSKQQVKELLNEMNLLMWWQPGGDKK